MKRCTLLFVARSGTLCRAIQRRNALLRDKGVARCFAIIHGGHRWWGCRLDIDGAFHVTDIVGYATHEELDSRHTGAITILIAASVHCSVEPLLAAAFEVSSPQAEMASVVAHKMTSFVFESIDFLGVWVSKCAEIP